MKLSDIPDDAPAPAAGQRLSSVSGEAEAPVEQPGMVQSLWQGLLHGFTNPRAALRQMGARSGATGETPEQAARLLSEAWQKIRELIHREAARDPQVNPLPFGAEPEGGWLLPAHGSISQRARFPGKRLPFGAAFEAHKSGQPHLHMLLRFEWIDYRWLRAQFVAEIDSPQFRDEKLDDPRKAAVYVTKYLTKNPTRFGNCKRYWFSRDYALVKWKPEPRFQNIPGRWLRDPTPFAEWIAFRSWEGCTIEHVCDGAAIVRAPPGDTEETHPVYDLEAHVRDKANEVEQRKARARAWHDGRAKFRD